MIRTSATLAFLLFSALSFATITQGTAVSGTNNNTTTVATSSGITTGANALVLVAVAFSNSSSSVDSISESSGSMTFSKVYGCINGTATFELWQGYTSGGLTNATITATMHYATYASVLAQSFTGTSTAVGNSNCRTGSATTFTAANVLNSGNSNSVYVQWINSNKPSSTFTPSSGFTLDANVTLALKLNTSDYIGPVVGSPTDQTITGSQTVSGAYDNSAVEIIAAPSGSTDDGQIM